MKSRIVCFCLFLVSVIVSTATVTSMFFGVSSLYNDIACIILVVTLILTALYSISSILSFYISKKI